MNQKLLPKPLLLAAIGISILSFVYVNIDACVQGKTLTNQIRVENTTDNLREEQPKDERTSPLPNISLVVHLLEVAKKFVPGGN